MGFRDDTRDVLGTAGMDYGHCGSRRASWRRGLIELNSKSIDWEGHSGGISMCKGSENATHNLLDIILLGIERAVSKSMGRNQAPPAFWRSSGAARTEAHTCVFPGEVQRYIHRGVERLRDLQPQHRIR